jgi:hypothetical protein
MWGLFYFLYNILAGDTSRFRFVWIIGVIYDIYVNVMWGTILCVQVPNIDRLFFSARLDYNILILGGYRQWISLKIVGYLLEPFDKSVPKQHKTYGNKF